MKKINILLKSNFMSEIKVFENSEFGKVRVSVVDGEPLFCLSDLCKILGLHTGATKKQIRRKGC